MFKKLVPFNAQTHANKKVKPVSDYRFAASSHLASLVVGEFARVAPTYPIVFLKEGENEKYGVYALLGLKSGENLFVTEEGKWDAPYIPAIIRRYPFALGRGGGERQFIICLDEESEFISETEGQPLVGEDGKPSAVIDKVKEYLSELYRMGELTERFCAEMVNMELLQPLTMQVKGPNDQTPQTIAGCYGVSENKFNQLSDENFLELRKKGAISLIYAHLHSLSNVERLYQRHQK